MLKQVHITNFKCLRDVTVQLGDFTVLIGPNDSGKSSFLSVIRSLAKFADDGGRSFRGANSLGNCVWRKEADRTIAWEVIGEARQRVFEYRLELAADGELRDERLNADGEKVFWTENAAGKLTVVRPVPGGKGKKLTPAQGGNTLLPQILQLPLYSSIKGALASSVEYRLDPRKLTQPSVPQAGIMLDPEGAKLAAVLDVMQNSADRTSFEAIQAALREAVPTLAGFVLPPSQHEGGAKALEFILAGKPPVTIPAALASSGALLLTAYLTLAYSQSADLLLFEEPENGLHPLRLQTVIDILRRISSGQFGDRKRQIVLTTHNPLLLNYVQPDEVRIFVRHPEAGTQVTTLEKVPDIDRLLKEFSLGELWYLLGEEKLIQGRAA